jgi:hypothetical protein
MHCQYPSDTWFLRLRSRTANVWSKTNLVVTQHRLLRFHGHLYRIAKAACNIVLQCSSENFERNAGLVWWRNPSTAYSLQCSNSSSQTLEEEEKEACAACVVVVTTREHKSMALVPQFVRRRLSSASVHSINSDACLTLTVELSPPVACQTGGVLPTSRTSTRMVQRFHFLGLPNTLFQSAMHSYDCLIQCIGLIYLARLKNAVSGRQRGMGHGCMHHAATSFLYGSTSA